MKSEITVVEKVFWVSGLRLETNGLMQTQIEFEKWNERTYMNQANFSAQLTF